MATRFVLVNNWSTTLNGAIAADATSLTLASVAGLESSGLLVVKIDNELLALPLNGTTAITGATRGLGGTTATTHASGAGVRGQIDSTLLDNLLAVSDDGTLVVTTRDLDVRGMAAVSDESGVARITVGLPVSTADVSSPPTAAELLAALGDPATVGAGQAALVDDGGAHTTEWLAVSDGTAWWYASLTKAT